MRSKTAALAALSFVVAFANAQSQRVDRARPRVYRARSEQAPDVSVWIDRFSYRPGQRIRAFFQSDPGAYVTILRVSTSGELRVLYPRTPSTQQPYRIDRLVDDEIPFSNELGFYLNEPEGVGFVFAVASFEPFDYHSVSNAGRWTTLSLAGNSYTDPYEVVGRFVNRTLSTWADYSSDFIQYQVAGTLYRPRRYGFTDYDDMYVQCLSVYRVADYYCRQYSQFGYGYLPYLPLVIGRPAPRPVAPGSPATGRRALPKKLVPDPVVKEEGIKTQKAEQRSPAGKAEAQRAWWNAQRREGGTRSGGVMVVGGKRVEPQVPSPTDYRTVPSEPGTDAYPESQYEPMRQRRFEAPVLRGEPHGGDAQSRSVPAPQPRVIGTPVYRVERFDPGPREIRPAPPPPPPPPPPAPAPVDRGDPAARTVHPPPPPPPPSR